MTEMRGDVKAIRRDHPVFFWGLSAVLLLLLIATVAMAIRIPAYRSQAQELDGSMTEQEKEVRDRILDSRAQRSELAIALLQRELRLRAMEEDNVHLAIDTEAGTLSLRHGDAVLRQAPIIVGRDSTISSPDGQTWRLVRPVGERHVTDKERNADLTIPEWYYVSRGEQIPADREVVDGGLGSYLLRLDDGTEIHTRPASGPFAEGVHPAGFIVEDDDAMAAIFGAISADTPVYIF